MNVPGTSDNKNWSYSTLPIDFSSRLANSLHELAIRYNRNM